MFAKVNGTKLYFDVEGAELVPDNGTWKKKPVCFVVHGGPGGEHIGFKPFLTPLSEHMQLIYIDQRGCGRSEHGPQSSYTLENNIEDLEALRKYLGLDQVVVLGHSYGGMVAQSYAIRYPDRVAALLLIATHPSYLFGQQAMQQIEVIGTEEQKKFAKLLFEGTLGKERMLEYSIVMEPLYFYSTRGRVRTEEEKQGMRNKKSNFNFEAANEGSKFLKTFDVIDQLHLIPCPTLVAGGRHDWITPVEASVLMAEKIPNSELVVFEESCHYLFIDEHEKFIAEISSFIQRRSEDFKRKD
ncbi:alpha/beta fold hydrolase [Brevibacillus reuszeri]|uniref:alpha/beta fold hydrolase n=1 Tax=Brevibacillus reuszeri TaxID=54915 RepID=UPI000CCC7346|nr:alpha/beta fold hydrolase [Brevibacillus reuszeri]